MLLVLLLLVVVVLMLMLLLLMLMLPLGSGSGATGKSARLLEDRFASMGCSRPEAPAAVPPEDVAVQVLDQRDPRQHVHQLLHLPQPSARPSFC